jgi:hypothetical protein
LLTILDAALGFKVLRGLTLAFTLSRSKAMTTKCNLKEMKSSQNVKISCFKKTSTSVTTLALGLQPRQRLTKAWAKREPRSHISCFQECKKVWGNEPPHSQMSSHFGNWCHNLSLGLATKAKGLQGCESRLSLGIPSSCPRDCKKMWGKKPSHSQVNFDVGS